MNNQLFEDLKKEFDIELHDTLKSYCDEIYNVYKETNSCDFKKTIEYFLYELSKKSHQMFFKDNRIYWYFKNDPISTNFKRILKITAWSNVIDYNDLFYIINIYEVFQYDINDEEFDIFILEQPNMFLTVYNHLNDILSR